MFPAYLKLDGDPELSEIEDKDLGKVLRDLGQTYQHKRQLLEATDRPVQEIFEVIDSTNNLDLQKVRSLTSNSPQETTSQLGHDVSNISECMRGILKVLGTKKHVNLQSKALDLERTIRFEAESVEALQQSVEASRKLQDERFDVLAKGSILKGVLQETRTHVESSQFDFLN